MFISYTQKRQELRSRAAPSTTLFFTPAASSSSPLQTKIGDTFTLDVMVNPGTNLPSIVKLDINYDPLKFFAAPTSFQTNLLDFPVTLEGPFINNGNIKISLSVGSDPTKAIHQTTKIGTITLKTLASTDTTASVITFGQNTLILSIASPDQANENILSFTAPAYIDILDLSPAPTPTLTATMLTLSAYLHGIGTSGDNTNPDDSRLSNKSPRHLQTTATAYIYNSSNELVSSSAGNLDYDAIKGNYSGIINLKNTIPQDQYVIKIHIPAHLRRLLPGIHTINPSLNNILPSATLITGDINNDNVLNVLDYKILIDCYSDLLAPKMCLQENIILSDLNDDGATNQVDYNLFLRELTTQSGN